MKSKRVFVSPDFATVLKIEAAKESKTILKFTDDLAKEIKNNVIDNEKIKPKKQLKGFFNEFQF